MLAYYNEFEYEDVKAPELPDPMDSLVLVILYLIVLRSYESETVSIQSCNKLNLINSFVYEILLICGEFSG